LILLLDSVSYTIVTLIKIKGVTFSKKHLSKVTIKVKMEIKMDEQSQLDERLKKVLRRAKRETATKDMVTFVFAGFFTTLLTLLAPFFQTNKNHKGK
jgi:hypothetical protein